MGTRDTAVMADDRPVIILVSEQRADFVRDEFGRYDRDYDLRTATSAAGAEALARSLVENGRRIALFVTESRLPDVPILAAYFLAQFRSEVAGISVNELSAEAIDRLMMYDFPGNVRELKNVVERAVYRASGAVLTAEDVDAAMPPDSAPSPRSVLEPRPNFFR